MLKTEHCESNTEHCWESSSASSEGSTVDGDDDYLDWESSSASSEDSAVDRGNIYILDDEDSDRFSEIVGDSEQDGDAEEDKDQDAGTDGHKHKDQRTETDEEENEDKNRELGKGEGEALDESLDLSGGKQSARNGDTIDISTLSTPHGSKAALSPVIKPHHETIALGQHHLWMI